MVSRQKVTLTLSEKIGLIKKTRPGISQCNLAAEYGISQSQVSCVIKDRDKILRGFNTCCNPSRKRQREGKYADV